MVVACHRRRIAEAVVRLAEAFVDAPAQQHRHRPGMAIGGELVAEGIEAHAKRVHLPPGDLLDRRAIGLEAVGVARLHRENDLPLPLELDLRIVAEAVAGIHPAIGAQAERVLIAVGVDEVERAVEDLARVGLAVAVGVGELPDVGDRPDDRLVAWPKGEDADRDVEIVGEADGLPGPAIGVEIGEDGEPVTVRGPVLRCEGILDRMRHPQSPPSIEGHVHRLLDLRLGCDKLDRKSFRQAELLELFRGGERFGGGHRGAGESGEREECRNHCKQWPNTHGNSGDASGKRCHDDSPSERAGEALTAALPPQIREYALGRYRRATSARGGRDQRIKKASRGRRWAALGGCRRLPTTRRCRGDSRPDRCGWGSR